MNETKFTPGPWKACGSHYSNDCKYVQLGEEDYTTTELLIPDAHLIAAAPELYEALEGLLADITEYQEINNLGGQNNHWQVKAKAALAKARGEG